MFQFLSEDQSDFIYFLSGVGFLFVRFTCGASSQVSVMVVAAGLSCVASVVISGYCGLTLTYGEEDEDVFHHLNTPEVVNQPQQNSTK